MNSKVYCKASWQLNVLRRIGSFFQEATALLRNMCFIKSHFDYCSLVWYHCGMGNSKKLERIQEPALRIVYDDTSSDYEILLQKAITGTLDFQWKHQLATGTNRSLYNSFERSSSKVKASYYNVWHWKLHNSSFVTNFHNLLN